MNNRGQTGAWEALIILILLISNAFTLYLLINKSAQTVVNQKGSQPTIHGNRTDYPFSIHIGEGGCARIPKEGDKK